MVSQFNREYSLQIISIPSGQTLSFSKLRITFEIEKNLSGYPNLGKIQIYNLTDDSVANIKKGDRIVLNAGYKDSVKLLFTGDIRNIFPERNRQDKITTIYAGDGEKAKKESFFSRAFEKGTPVKDIIMDVVSSFKGVATGEIEGIEELKNKLLGTSYSGASKDVLDKLVLDYGLNWSIQDGKIVIHENGKASESKPVVIVSRSSGMIGSPVVTEIGVDVTTQLNSALEINGLIRVESDAPGVQLSNVYFRNITRLLGNGIFRINKIRHVGGNREANWQSSITGFRLIV